MSVESTILIKPSNFDEIPDAVAQMCTDLQVGGVLLQKDLASRVINEGFQQLAQGVPTKGAAIQRVGEQITHDCDTSWHLAHQSEVPTIRFWQHRKGSIHFTISRAVPEWDFPGWCGEDEVAKFSYGKPIEFIPSTGEALIFVDQGTPSITGTSSFHKTDLKGAAWFNTRESSAIDIFF